MSGERNGGPGFYRTRRIQAFAIPALIAVAIMVVGVPVGAVVAAIVAAFAAVAPVVPMMAIVPIAVIEAEGDAAQINCHGGMAAVAVVIEIVRICRDCRKGKRCTCEQAAHLV